MTQHNATPPHHHHHRHHHQHRPVSDPLRKSLNEALSPRAGSPVTSRPIPGRREQHCEGLNAVITAAQLQAKQPWMYSAEPPVCVGPAGGKGEPVFLHQKNRVRASVFTELGFDNCSRNNNNYSTFDLCSAFVSTQRCVTYRVNAKIKLFNKNVYYSSKKGGRGEEGRRLNGGSNLGFEGLFD